MESGGQDDEPGDPRLCPGEELGAEGSQPAGRVEKGEKGRAAPGSVTFLKQDDGEAGEGQRDREVNEWEPNGRGICPPVGSTSRAVLYVLIYLYLFDRQRSREGKDRESSPLLVCSPNAD